MNVSCVRADRFAEPLEEPPPKAMLRIEVIAKKWITRDASA